MSPRFAGLFNGPLLIAGLVPLLLVGHRRLVHVRRRAVPRELERERQPSDLALSKQSLALVFWAYLGLESASVAAAVVENPERNVPIATIAGVLLAALIYMAVSAAMMGLAPASDLANSIAPFALVAGEDVRPGGGPAGRRAPECSRRWARSPAGC